MPGPNTTMAAFAGANVSPELLARYKRLLGGPERLAAADPTAAAAETEAAVENPLSRAQAQYAADELTGGGEAPARRPLRSFEETAGGKMAGALLEKRKNLKWWLPEQFANRNERDMAQALEMARLEMGADESADRSTQGWANLLGERLEAGRRQTRWEGENEDRDAQLEATKKRWADDLEAATRNFANDEANTKLRAGELAERRAARVSAERESRATRSDARTMDFLRLVIEAGGAGLRRPAAAPGGAGGNGNAAGRAPLPLMPAHPQALSPAAAPGSRPRLVRRQSDGKLFYQLPSGELRPAPETR